MAIPQIVADFDTQLSTALTVGGTSFSLSSILDDDGNTIPSGTYYFTVDNNSTAKEFVTGLLSGSTVASVKSVSRQGVETSGAARAHRVGASVIITDFNTYKKYMDGLALAGAPTATPSTLGVAELSVPAANPSSPVVIGDNDPRIPTVPQVSFLSYVTGMVLPYLGYTAPNGFLLADGSSYDNDTYPNLSALSQGRYGIGTLVTFTASGSVITAASHGLSAGNLIFVQNSGGALPSGLAANTPYYIVNPTISTFQVSVTSGGAAVTLSSAGTGTNSFSNFFMVPDLRGRAVIGAGIGTKVATIVSVSPNVITVSGLASANNNEFQTGQRVLFAAGVAGNLVTATNYYVIRTGNATFSVATTLINAQNGVVIVLAGTETGTFSLSLSARSVGDTGGEETHAMTSTELLYHSHPVYSSGGGGPLSVYNASTIAGNSASNIPTGPTGGNSAMNTMSPFAVMNFIIKT